MRTFKLACPKCGADEGQAITINLNDMDVVVCSECGEEFTAQEAAEHFRHQSERWAAVVQWIESAPTPDD